MSAVSGLEKGDRLGGSVARRGKMVAPSCAWRGGIGGAAGRKWWHAAVPRVGIV
jgi:hypothetical protein